MLLKLRSLFIPLFALVALATAKSSSGDKVLVVLEPSLDKDEFSQFFGGLEDSGFSLTFRAPKDVGPAIIEDDLPNFSHVILFAPETKTYASDITPQNLVALLRGHTNLLIASSTKQTPLTSLASEFSLISPPPGTPLLSHFPPRDDPPTVMRISLPFDSIIITPKTNPVWYSGTAWALGNNPQLVPILRAPAEAVASDATSDSGADALVEAAEKGGEGLWAGSSLAVVVGFQTMEQSRVTWVGGVDLFSDKFADRNFSRNLVSGNKQISRDIAAWTFQENLVLRIDSTEHHLVNQTEPKSQYTTNDQIVYSAYISRFNPAIDTWERYSDLNDLQFEFTMLDPHVRAALLPVAGEPGKYSATFRAPDRHGVFKFIINYKRRGYTHLQSSTTVPLVPPRHDGYPRFLSAAWPYYAGAISTSVGFLLFSAMWLAGDAREMTVKKGKKTE